MGLIRLTWIIFLLFPLCAWAQLEPKDPFDPQPVDPSKVPGGLSEVVSKFAATKGFKANFLMSHYPKGQKRPLKYRGRLAFDEDQGLLWQIQQPLPEALWISMDGIMKLSSQGNTKVGDDPGILLLLQALAAGRFDQMARGASLSFGESKGEWELTVTPTDGVLAGTLSHVKFRGKRANLLWVQVVEKDLSVTSIRLYNLQRFEEGLSQTYFFFLEKRPLDFLP